ncbi:MAG: nucleotidyltransferase family protein [Bradyrhizobiaceae bacterium]|nr:nucleotidyltransferase family protein [Bradyrhizobiaceae bacterium]
MPAHAMVLAAGLGTRMRENSKTQPKPLVPVQKRALIDHVLDRLADAGVANVVVNVHYFADQLEAHLQARERPRVAISDERKQLLGTGGGITKALPLLGNAPFLLVNSDSLWVERTTANLVRLAKFFDRLRMDAALLLAATGDAHGYDGSGDYALEADGRLRRRPERGSAPYVYMGVAILSPRLFDEAPRGVFGLGTLFDRAEKAGRLMGLKLEGTFLHVGTPEAIKEAEAELRRAGA